MSLSPVETGGAGSGVGVAVSRGSWPVALEPRTRTGLWTAAAVPTPDRPPSQDSSTPTRTSRRAAIRSPRAQELARAHPRLRPGAWKVIPGASGCVESFLIGESSRRGWRGRLGGARVRARHPGTGPGAGVLPGRCSHGPDGAVEVVTAVVGATTPPAARPADALPDRSEAADCPNLPQRPRPSRSAREETFIFRAFLRGQSRPGAPLWQIWTHPRPESPQEPHPPHAGTPRITFLGAGGGWLLSTRTNPAAGSRRSRSRPSPS